MADAIVYPYANFIYALGTEKHNFAADSLRFALTTSSYVPDLDDHNYYDDITNELPTANGYTSGGVTIAYTDVTWAVVKAADAAQWGSATDYKLGQIVRKVASNGHVYRCIVAGTSGGSEPTWPTNPGETVTDNTVIWAECGSCYVKLDFPDPSWSSSSFTARYGVLYNYSSGTGPSTRALIALWDFQSDRTSVASTFSVTIDGQGALLLPLL